MADTRSSRSIRPCLMLGLAAHRTGGKTGGKTSFSGGLALSLDTKADQGLQVYLASRKFDPANFLMTMVKKKGGVAELATLNRAKRLKHGEVTCSHMT